MNKTNVIPAEISPTSLAFLDWLFFYTRESTDGMLEKNVSESFKRMKVLLSSHFFNRANWSIAGRLRGPRRRQGPLDQEHSLSLPLQVLRGRD